MAAKRGRKWIPVFLEALADSPNVSGACHKAGVNRQYVYELRESDPAFAAAWDDALEQSTDALVGEAYRRARDGTAKPVFYQGEACGHVREYSDTLTIFLLKAHRPAVYREPVPGTATSDEPDPVAAGKAERALDAADPGPEPEPGA